MDDSQSKLLIVKRLGMAADKLPAGEYLAPHNCLECGTTQGIRVAETHCVRCRLIICFDRFVAERKLSVKGWEKLRRILSLPAAVAKLPPDKARALLPALNEFVAQFSFDEQNSITDKEITKWLNELPNLPSIFVKVVKSKAKSKSDAPLTVPLTNSTIIQTENNSPKRKSITTKQFTEVVARQGFSCYWCGVKVVRQSDIPPENRLTKNQTTIVYCIDGKLREEYICTIDHLVRVTDGGDNDPLNLVISCYWCNHERERVTAAYHQRLARRDRRGT